MGTMEMIAAGVVGVFMLLFALSFWGRVASLINGWFGERGGELHTPSHGNEHDL